MDPIHEERLPPLFPILDERHELPHPKIEPPEPAPPVASAWTRPPPLWMYRVLRVLIRADAFLCAILAPVMWLESLIWPDDIPRHLILGAVAFAVFFLTIDYAADHWWAGTFGGRSVPDDAESRNTL